MIHLEVNAKSQELTLLEQAHVLQRYRVSTGLKGLGEQAGSEQTPRGWHFIRAKIGADAPENTVFVGRRPTGEVFSPALRDHYPERDWILTRILWLCGSEPGFNRHGNVDTQRRFIYIHGTPDDVEMGRPGSRGCIRMRNADLIELFDRVSVNTRLLIRES